jgi:hypothetical protein
MIRALRAIERESRGRNPFDFGARLRFDAATVTKIKISPGTPVCGVASCRAHYAPRWVDLSRLAAALQPWSRAQLAEALGIPQRTLS